jgi:hypothetical protein
MKEKFSFILSFMAQNARTGEKTERASRRHGLSI